MDDEVLEWPTATPGNVTGGSDAFVTPRELARLEQLLLDRGRWAGEQRTDVRTGHAELLAEGGFAWPEWSPDGTGIADVTQRNDEPLVSTLDLDSGEHIDVAPGDFPVWSADGRSILPTRDNESVVAVELDDGTQTVVTEGCCASIAPDGQRLIVSRDS